MEKWVPEGQGATPRWRKGSVTPPESPTLSLLREATRRSWVAQPSGCCLLCEQEQVTASPWAAGATRGVSVRVSLSAGLRDIAYVKSHVQLITPRSTRSVPGTKWGRGPGALSSFWASG